MDYKHRVEMKEAGNLGLIRLKLPISRPDISVGVQRVFKLYNGEREAV